MQIYYTTQSRPTFLRFFFSVAWDLKRYSFKSNEVLHIFITAESRTSKHYGSYDPPTTSPKTTHVQDKTEPSPFWPHITEVTSNDLSGGSTQTILTTITAQETRTSPECAGSSQVGSMMIYVSLNYSYRLFCIG